MVFRTYRNSVIIALILGVIAGVVGFRFSPKTYLATVPLLIATERESDFSSLLSMGTAQSVQTEAAILKSENLFDVALAEISSRRGDPSLVSLETQADLYRKYEVAPDGRVANINVSASDPGLAADLANEIAAQYNVLRRKSSGTSIAGAQRYYETQVALADRDLRGVEGRIEAYKRKVGIADLGSQTTGTVSAEATLESQLTGAKAEVVVLNSDIAEQKRRMANLPQKLESTFAEVQTPAIGALEGLLLTYENSRVEALRVYSPQSTKVSQIDELIAQTQARIVESRKTQWLKNTRSFQIDPIVMSLRQELVTNEIRRESMGKRIDALASALASERQKMDQLPGQEMSLARLNRERDVYQSKFLTLRTALEQLKLRGANGMMQASVLFPATPNPEPVAPTISKFLVAGAVGGTCLGILIAFGLTTVRPYADSTHQLDSVLGLPVIATFPALGGSDRRKLATLNDPSFTPSEGARLAATSLFSPTGKFPKVVLFAGTEPSTKWSELCAEVAVASARLGYRTTLLDFDFRQPSLSRMAGRNESAGIRDVLVADGPPTSYSEVDPSEGAIVPVSTMADLSTAPSNITGHTLLRMVGAGQTGPESVADVTNQRLGEVFSSLRGSSDVILLIAPPFTASSDAYRLAQFSDEVCLLVAGRGSDIRRIATVKETLGKTYQGTISALWATSEDREEEFPYRRPSVRKAQGVARSNSVPPQGPEV